MSDKLQELTQKLYNEGLSKGREEGEQILAKARQEASEIVKAAQAQADEIVGSARRQAEDLKSKAASDIRMASAQALQATRKDIEDLVVTQLSADKVKAAAADPDYLKTLIQEVCRHFSADEPADLQLVLPAALQAQLEPWVKKELSAALGKGVQASFSKKIAGGFTIGPKDGSYFISMTDESFQELIAAYLRPVTRKLLFEK